MVEFNGGRPSSSPRPIRGIVNADLLGSKNASHHVSHFSHFGIVDKANYVTGCEGRKQPVQKRPRSRFEPSRCTFDPRHIRILAIGCSSTDEIDQWQRTKKVKDKGRGLACATHPGQPKQSNAGSSHRCVQHRLLIGTCNSASIASCNMADIPQCGGPMQ